MNDEPTRPDSEPAPEPPTITFTTRGHGARTLRLEMLSPGPDRFTKSHATLFRVTPSPAPEDERPGYFVPATFRVHGLSTPDGGALPVTFTIDRVVSVWESGPAREHVGIVELRLGADHDDSVWAAAEKIMRAPRPAAPWRVTNDTLRAIPVQTLLENALTLAQCRVRVRLVPDGTVDERREALRHEHVYRGADGLALLAVPVAPDTDRRDAGALTGTRRRGKARGTQPGHKSPDVLAFAVECYRAGLSIKDTVEAFDNDRGETWSPPTIESMWNEAQRQGLMKRGRRKKPERRTR